MAQTIVRLPEIVINQIAAGEVVENPASVVKELVENSLDAGARRIEVTVEEQLIQVEDDGRGMDREDALLSLERHATSKIRVTEDLQTLGTMGFRGEALAAIAAVSHLEMKTSQGGAGTRVVARGGQVETIEPVARNPGTTISVRSLFYNTPARKKFQKSRAANRAQVVRMVETIALAYPEVAFTLTSNGEKTVSLEMQEKRARIEEILGPFREVVMGEGIWGLLAAPEEARAQRRGQYVFVNGRPIFSPLVARAVQVGYGTRLMEGLYPPFILFLELDPQEVDVNVHPQKREVRFHDEGKLFRSIEEAVAGAFHSLPVATPAFSFSEPTPFPFSLAEEPTPAPMAQLLPLSFSEKPLCILSPYLFLEAEELLLVDLRKAHARILFEALTEKKGALQPLLWPLEVSIDEESLGVALEQMGIECRVIGKKRLAIDALPSPLEAADVPLFLSTWREGKEMQHLTSRFSHLRKRSYTLEEGMAFWKQLMACREKRVDPLGEVIWKKIEVQDLECLLKEKECNGS